MRIYIIRHADPDYANDTITPAGHLEAQALAKRMSSIGLDRIYCSPLGRAVATMRYTSDLLGVPATTEEWTREMSDCRMGAGTRADWVAWDCHGEIIRGAESFPRHDNWHDLPSLSNPII